MGQDRQDFPSGSWRAGTKATPPWSADATATATATTTTTTA
ncbi:hypothetical protein [Streptomyces zaomyceticus]